MFPTPNCFWVCDKCGHEVYGFRDENDVASLIVDVPTCPDCRVMMKEQPPMRTLPPYSNPFKKY